MGQPRFYYYPDETGSLEVIDLGEGLSDLQETSAAIATDTYAADGKAYRSFQRDTFEVRIVLERFGTPGVSSLERKLQNLQSHLQRGGWVGFSRDHAKAWASIRSGAASRGDTIFYTGGSGFLSWSSSATLAAGDEVVIESAPPDSRREISTVSALSSGGDVSLGTALVYTYDGHPIIRWRDFYPTLRLAAGNLRPIVTHDHRRNWTLDATFEYSVADHAALWTDYSTPYDSPVVYTPGPGGFGGSRPAMRDDTGGRLGVSLETALGSRDSFGGSVPFRRR